MARRILEYITRPKPTQGQRPHWDNERHAVVFEDPDSGASGASGGWRVPDVAVAWNTPHLTDGVGVPLWTPDAVGYVMSLYIVNVTAEFDDGTHDGSYTGGTLGLFCGNVQVTQAPVGPFGTIDFAPPVSQGDMNPGYLRVADPFTVRLLAGSGPWTNAPAPSEGACTVTVTGWAPA